MQINLPENHPSFTGSYEIKELLKSYFPKSPISFFSIWKVYKDGSTSIITTNAKYLKSFLEEKDNTRKAYSCAKPNFIDKYSYWFLLDQHSEDFPCQHITRAYDIYNGLCFLERHIDCYYMISFATNNNVDNVIDYYFGNFEIMRNFICFFRETKNHLLDAIDRKRIILPAEAQDIYKNTLLLNKKSRYPVFYQNIKSYVTAQEFECIKRLPLGKSTKDIAHDLTISHRTVEGYLNRVMMRTGCTNKRELIVLLKQSGFP